MNLSNSLARSLPWQPRVALRPTLTLVKPRLSALGPDLIARGRVTQTDVYAEEIEPRRVLQSHLTKLCAYLETRMRKPIRIHDDGVVRDVWVFDAVVYRFDRRQRAATFGHIDAAGQTHWREGWVELMLPLCKPKWIELVEMRMDLLNESGHPDLFSSRVDRECIREWLSIEAYRVLKRDPRFIKLRRVDLPKAFDLDPTIRSLTLMSRQYVREDLVTSAHFQRVWQNEAAYRRVGAVSPQLLPLLDARLKVRALKPDESPLTALKDDIRAEGFTQASWRYLLHHGSRIFRELWLNRQEKYMWSEAMHYLGLLQDAGLPPPPPPSVLRAWVTFYRGEDEFYLPERKVGVLSKVIGLAFTHADQLRRAGKLIGFADRFVDVMTWANYATPVLDRHRRNGGWRSLERLAKTWMEQRSDLDQASDSQWKTWYPRFRWNGCNVHAISSEFELVRQGQILRNCIADYVKDCAEDLLRIYVVTKPGRSRPLAHISVVFDLAKWRWAPWQARGFANADLGDEYRLLVESLASRFNWEESRGLNRNRIGCGLVTGYESA